MDLTALLESGLNEAGTAVAAIIDTDRGLAATVAYANRPFLDAVGLTSDQVIGLALTAVLIRSRNFEQRNQLANALRSRQSVQMDMVLSAAGEDRYLGLRLSFPSVPGAEQSAVLIGRDITQLRRSATQEEKMRQLLAEIFNRVNAPVMIVARNGEIVMSNNAYRQFTGFSKGDLKRARIQDLTPAELFDSALGPSESQLADGTRFGVDFETLTKSGSRIPVRLTWELLLTVDQSYRVATLLPRTAEADQVVLETHIRAAIDAAHAGRSFGELRAIDFDMVSNLFGPNWEHIGLRVMMRAETAIRKRLRSDDLVSRTNKNTFLIWFGSRDVNANDELLNAIIRDVRLTFLTEFGTETAARVDAVTILGADR